MILSKIDPFVASVALFHIHSITGKDRKEIIEFAKNIIDGSMVSSDWKKNLRRTYLKTKYDYLYFKMDKSRVMHLPQIKNDLYFFEMEDSPLLFKMFAMSEKFHLALKIDELREICQLVPDAATAIHKSNVSLLHFASSLFPIRDSDEVPFEAIQVLLKKNRQKKDEIVKVIDHLMESISSTLKIMKETKTVSSDVHIFITERIKASECLVKTFLENLKYKSDDVIKLPVSESKKIFAPLFGSEKVGIRMSELKKMITYFSKQLVSELGHRGFLDKIESSPKVQNAIT